MAVPPTSGAPRGTTAVPRSWLILLSAALVAALLTIAFLLGRETERAGSMQVACDRRSNAVHTDGSPENLAAVAVEGVDLRTLAEDDQHITRLQSIVSRGARHDVATALHRDDG